MVEHEHFTISEEFDELRSVLKKKSRGRDKSRWICLAMKNQLKADRENQTLDYHVEKQRVRDEDNKRLDEFAFQVNEKSSPEYLIDHYTYDDIKLICKLAYRLELNAKLAVDDLDELKRTGASGITYFPGASLQ